jgi:two-component system, NtrC family, sensor kinase
MSYKDAKPYLVSLLILLAAVFLWNIADPLVSVAVAILAVATFFQTNQLMDYVKKANEQRRIIDEQVCRVEKFATVDELSAGIAHEINNPLGIIAQEAQWIQQIFKSDSFKDVPELDDCKDSLKEIDRQVDRCKEIVHKLLSLAREMEPVIQCVDVNGLIESMTDLVEREVQARNIRLDRRLQPDLPAVYSDPPLLRQVILNLLVNATHAIEKDGLITITTSSTDNGVDIVVKDTGCGIPREQLQRIFTPFFTTKPQGQGSGLGLAICRGILERLGGSISVNSDVGKSTAFTIHLPINRPLEGVQ